MFTLFLFPISSASILVIFFIKMGLVSQDALKDLQALMDQGGAKISSFYDFQIPFCLFFYFWIVSFSMMNVASWGATSENFPGQSPFPKSSTLLPGLGVSLIWVLCELCQLLSFLGSGLHVGFFQLILSPMPGNLEILMMDVTNCFIDSSTFFHLCLWIVNIMCVVMIQQKRG